MRSTKTKRVLSLLLCVMLLFSQMGAAAYAEGTTQTGTDSLCEHHSEHTTGCGYAEGRACGYVCELCGALPDKDGGTPELSTESCSCMERCRAENVNTACPICKDAQEKCAAPEADNGLTITVIGWKWIDPGADLTDGNLALPGVNEDNQADFDTVVSMLPEQISATVNGADEKAEITLAGWACNLFKQDEAGSWPAAGDYLFTASLPEGYVLTDDAPRLEVAVTLGGADMLPTEDAVETGDFTVSGGTKGTDFEYADNTLTVRTSTALTISGTTQKDKIVVDAEDADITINNLSAVLSECNGSAIEIKENKTATLVLTGKNELTAFAAGPGILVGQGATLTIQESAQDGSLTVKGAQYKHYDDRPGVSVLEPVGFAGIGGPNSDGPYSYTGTINIKSGTITSTGYGYGAGIGGGDFSSGGAINLSGGKVTALCGGENPDGWASSGAKNASGIGASQGQPSGKITISDDAEVTAYGGSACAGIGGGVCDITIKGSANVTAYGGDCAAGIGGYDQAKGNSGIRIADAVKVTAYGGKSASGLGQGSNNAAVFELTIADTADVNAYSDGSKAAITGTPAESSTSLLNLFMKDAALPSRDVTLNISQPGGSQTPPEVILPKGWEAFGKSYPAGTYSVSTTMAESSYKLIPCVGNAVNVAAGSDAEAYSGTQMIMYGVSEGGAAIQLNPPNGLTITSGSTDALQFDPESGNIIVPPNGTVSSSPNAASKPLPKGGSVSRTGVVTPVFDPITFTQNLPTSMGAVLDKSLTLTVSADPPQDGCRLVYFWKKGNSILQVGEKASYTIGKVQEADLGAYHVWVQKFFGDNMLTSLESETCTVSRAIAAISVTLDQSELNLYSNSAPKSAALTATVAPADATDKSVTWSSSSEAVAKVDNGVVTAIGRGDAVITAATMDGSHTASCTVHVTTKSNGGGGSGGSDSSEMPKQPEGEIVSVVVRPITENSKPKLTATISDEKLKELIDRKVEQYNINSTALSFGLPLNTLQQLDAVSGRGDIILTAVQTANPAGGIRPAWNITLVYRLNEKDTPITLPSGKEISVKLPYTLGTGEQAGSVYAITTSAGKVVWLSSSSYDPGQKEVLFSISGAGIYGVGCKTPALAFTDISGHWAKTDIDFVTSRGLLFGTGEDMFSPDSTITRGMFVTALGRLAGIDPAAYSSSRFTDVPVTDYYASYVAWAASKGIVTGTGETTFSPDAAVTREQMAVILQRYAQELGSPLPLSREAESFADEDQVSRGMKDAVRAVQQANIMNGKGSHCFCPGETATRAEAAAVLRRFVEIVIDPASADGWAQNDARS